MQRREFLATGAAALGGSLSVRNWFGREVTPTGPPPFKLKYAPHFGMFRNHAPELLDQLQFMVDQGFEALEDNGMAGREVELQNRIAAEMQRLNMEMGVFVATGDFGNPTFTSGREDLQEKTLADIRRAVEVAKRVNAKWCTVVPGIFDHRKQIEYQTANAIDLLKRCAEICEPSGLVMVLEPLNHWRNHPELFLSKIPQAYMICRSVGSPSCKVLDDLYHQQITEGNLIPNIDRAWDEIAYFQTGDNPGRNEPTTGEINYKNVFRHIHNKGFTGIIGMEHGNSMRGIEGELAVIRAYREVDDF